MFNSLPGLAGKEKCIARFLLYDVSCKAVDFLTPIITDIVDDKGCPFCFTVPSK